MTAAVHKRSEGEYRVTAPLYGGGVSDGGFEVPPQRYPLSPSVEYVILDEAERLRLEGYFGGRIVARLEMFGITPYIPGYATDDNIPKDGRPHSKLVEEANRVLALQRLAVRVTHPVVTMNVDQLVGGTWTRITDVDRSWSRHQGQWPGGWIPPDRITTWQLLLEHWPSSSKRKRLHTALEYYSQSVAALWDEAYRDALLSCATATELLLSDVTQEITYRISNRGAQLVAPGPEGNRVRKELARLYGARSKATHSGAMPKREDVVSWQHFLMAALPRAAAYPHSDAQLLDDLDEAPFDRPAALRAVDAGGWWDYCYYPSLLP